MEVCLPVVTDTSSVVVADLLREKRKSFDGSYEGYDHMKALVDWNLLEGSFAAEDDFVRLEDVAEIETVVVAAFVVAAFAVVASAVVASAVAAAFAAGALAVAAAVLVVAAGALAVAAVVVAAGVVVAATCFDSAKDEDPEADYLEHSLIGEVSRSTFLGDVVGERVPSFVVVAVIAFDIPVAAFVVVAASFAVVEFVGNLEFHLLSHLQPLENLHPHLNQTPLLLE